MFYKLDMPAEVELQPRHFGPTMRRTLEEKLTKEARCWHPIERLKQSPSGRHSCSNLTGSIWRLNSLY